MTVAGRHRAVSRPHWWHRWHPSMRRRLWLRPAGPPPPGWVPTASHVPTELMRPPWGRSARVRARYNLVAALALFALTVALLLGSLALHTAGPPLRAVGGSRAQTSAPASAPASAVYHDR
ncbi:MAG TPA: hypothetical protein VFY38_05695 [Pseudonocardia sp.]|nr:hypothetical protein [Pseudonocardia sp.]